MSSSKKAVSKELTLDSIASSCAEVACEVYGVIALVPSKSHHYIHSLLKRENNKDGVRVRKLSNNSYSITIFCVLAYGVKINEVIAEVQKNVKYSLEKKLKRQLVDVNVFVRDIK